MLFASEGSANIKIEDRAFLEWQSISYFVPVEKPSWLPFANTGMRKEETRAENVMLGMPKETIITNVNDK